MSSSLSLVLHPQFILQNIPERILARMIIITQTSFFFAISIHGDNAILVQCSFIFFIFIIIMKEILRAFFKKFKSIAEL